MEFALQYEIQRSQPHHEGFIYDIYHQATEQVKLADRGKDAIDFTTRKGAELFTPFAKREVKGYEYYKKMAEAAVALGDYRLSTEDLNKRIEAGAVMVGDPEDCLKVAKMYESAGVDLLLMLVQVAAIPHEKVLQTIDLIGRHVMPKLNPHVTAIEAESAAAAR